MDKAHRIDKIVSDASRHIEIAAYYRRPHVALVWTGHGRAVPRIVPRRGSVVHRELVPSGFSAKEAAPRGEDLGLTDDKSAFDVALVQNTSAVEVMGIDEFKVIATELVLGVRRSVTIDLTIRESARAKIRVMVRRILRRHSYPPDLQAEATKLVLEQAKPFVRIGGAGTPPA